MTKTLTEQWREGTLTEGYYYIRWSFDIDDEPSYMIDFYDRENFSGGAFINKQHKFIDEVMCAVPSYDKVKDMSQKIERLEFDNEALEMAHNEGKEINAELVSKTDELVQKIHILNEQNTKQYNELCEEIKKNNTLEKRLKIATKALKEYADRSNWIEGNFMCVYDGKSFADEESAEQAIKEMEGVK